MARYYFDIHDSTGDFRDEDGLDLPSLEAAELEARRTLAGLLRDMLEAGKEDTIEVRIRNNAGGPIVLRVGYRSEKPRRGSKLDEDR